MGTDARQYLGRRLDARVGGALADDERAEPSLVSHMRMRAALPPTSQSSAARRAPATGGRRLTRRSSSPSLRALGKPSRTSASGTAEAATPGEESVFGWAGAGPWAAFRDSGTRSIARAISPSSSSIRLNTST